MARDDLGSDARFATAAGRLARRSARRRARGMDQTQDAALEAVLRHAPSPRTSWR
jgi:hypothetical protein